MIVPSSLTTMNQANQLTQLCFSQLKKFTTMAKKNHQKCRQTKNNYQTQTIGLTRFVLSALFQYFSSSTQKKHITVVEEQEFFCRLIVPPSLSSASVANLQMYIYSIPATHREERLGGSQEWAMKSGGGWTRAAQKRK